jgi:hypothetical protein
VVIPAAAKAAAWEPRKSISRQNKRARLPVEDEPMGYSYRETFFDNPAIRAILSWDDQGPVVLRPRISPSLPLSECYIWYTNLFLVQ